MAIIPQNVYYGIKTKYLNKFKIDYQGTVAAASDLPEGNIPKGTVYSVEADDSSYLWTGEEWVSLGVVDSNLVHKTGTERVGGTKTFTDYIRCDNSSEQKGISGTSSAKSFLVGASNSINSGSYVQLYGKDSSSNAGIFSIVASIGSGASNKKVLQGSPDGTLSWDGQTIQTTSDERLKTSLAAVPAEVLDAWEDVAWGQFQFLEAVNEKGSSARLHLGLIAQRVKAAFEARGLDACAYSILCHEERKATDDAPAVDLWMVRYEEALAMEAVCQRRRADHAEARIKALEDRLSALEAKLD